ncbi:MAG: tripartite tricarboxylate transporter substrate binding protein [Hyphomicrobiales bacterium]|nr:tripartite tricarboxylate transporter substrate binding protein [Hyphomicrobiales bacterium]
MRLMAIAGALAVALCPIPLGQAHADYPQKPIRMIVTIAPGGAPDVVARVLAQKLTETIGQSVVVENKPGANGTIAGEFVVRATPDGYTLLFAADSPMVINPHIYKMSYDPLRDLVPVASVATQSEWFLAVNPDLPVRTLPEFVDYARRADPPLRYASGGIGSLHQIGMELLAQRAGIKLTHVPFRGGTPAVTATLSGQTHAVLAGGSVTELLASGKLRGLAATGTKRSARFADLPRVADFYPGYEVTSWFGVFAPAGTPAPVLAKLRSEVHKALPAIAPRLNITGGLEPFIASEAEFAAFIRREYEKNAAIIKQMGIRIE